MNELQPILHRAPEQADEIPVAMERQEIFDALKKHREFFIKFAHLRTSPHFAGQDFNSLRNEFEVLSQMYDIDADHIVKPISLEKDFKFMVLENLLGFDNLHNVPGGLKKCLTDNPAFTEALKKLVEKLHSNDLAHGDLLQNIMVSIDTDPQSETAGKIIDWVVVDPVGVSKESGTAFDAAVESDGKAVEFLQNLISGKEDLSDNVETPIRDRTKVEKVLLSPKASSLITALENEGVNFLSENRFSVRGFIQERGQTIEEFYVAKTEFLSQLVKPISEALIKNTFQDVSVVIKECLLTKPRTEISMISKIDIEKMLEMAEKLQINIISGIELISTIEKLQEENELGKDIECYLVDGAVVVVYDKEKYDKHGLFGTHFTQNNEDGNIASANTIRIKKYDVPYIALPKDAIKPYIVSHEVRHTTLNKALFEQLRSGDYHLKEEVVAFLACGESVEGIINLLRDEYGFSNYFHFDDMVYTLRRLSPYYKNNELADLLSVVPINEWARFTRRKEKSNGVIPAKETPTS